jgi:hypothetical protein
MSLMVVKFSLPWWTCTIDFLVGLASLVAAPWFCELGLGQSLM